MRERVEAQQAGAVEKKAVVEEEEAKANVAWRVSSMSFVFILLFVIDVFSIYIYIYVIYIYICIAFCFTRVLVCVNKVIPPKKVRFALRSPFSCKLRGVTR